MPPPNMDIVKKYARKHGYNVSKINKAASPYKLSYTTPTGDVVKFGAIKYEDFTTHKDKTRQKNYCTRSQAISSDNKKYSKNTLARKLLWDC
jgi:hypothetical protein